MTLPPWVIEELEDERRRRDEEERIRSNRIELPQTQTADPQDRGLPVPHVGVTVVDISPRPDNTLEI